MALISLNALTIVANEPRILDVTLAEKLGFSQARDIRKIIDRNSPELETYGTLARHAGASISGKGRQMETEQYYLNEPQAILLCMFSRTPKAAEVRKALIEVFMLCRHGANKTPTLVQRYVTTRVTTVTRTGTNNHVDTRSETIEDPNCDAEGNWTGASEDWLRMARNLDGTPKRKRGRPRKLEARRISLSLSRLLD